MISNLVQNKDNFDGGIVSDTHLGSSLYGKPYKHGKTFITVTAINRQISRLYHRPTKHGE
jgi:hypothetical protein